MIILLKLLLAHFLGDFALQPKSWVAEKEQQKIKSPKLWLHLLIHGLLAFLLLWDLQLWLLALAVVILHGVIDIIKLYAQSGKNMTLWFLTDQLLHIGGILGLYCLWFRPEWLYLRFWESPVLWIYVLAIVFLTFVAGIAIRILLAQWSVQLQEPSGTLDNAGKYIGILERLLTFAFIISGHWEAIGFLLAAKSVFRFGDLKESKDRKLTEYILIGTFLSFSLALAVGMLAKYGLQTYSVSP